MSDPIHPPLRQLLGHRYGKGNTEALLRRALRDVPGAAALLDELERVAGRLDRPDGPASTPSERASDGKRRRAIEGWRDASLEAIRSLHADTWTLGQTVAPKDPPRPIGPGRKERTGKAVAKDGNEGRAKSAFQSTPARDEPRLSLDLLRPSTRGDAHDNRNWTPPAAIVELMGKVSDAELGRMAGVSAELVADRRARLGIAAAETDKDAHHWTPAMDKLLGTRTDDELARKWDRSAEAVRRRREKMGIPASRRKISWQSSEVIALLDSEPDNAKVATQLGVTVNAVKIARSRRNSTRS